MQLSGTIFTILNLRLLLVSVQGLKVLALDLEGVHDLKLHHPSSSVATSNQ